MKRKLLISFSGGRTSAYMTKWLIENKKDEYDFVVVFANTGKEREETLEFVRDCDINFGFNTVWIETVMNAYGVGASFKVVNFETADRKGSTFESVIAKHGIPNVSTKHCTRELKTTPIKAYVKSLGWKPKEYETAIGFRIDEPKRWAGKKVISAKKKKHFYPLVYEQPMRKEDINFWWDQQAFNLQLKEHEGNCDLCWKKSENKLVAIAGVCPKRTEWWLEMEKKYENYTPESKKHNPLIKPPHRFFRNNLSVEDLQGMAAEYFKGTEDDEVLKEVYEQALINGYDTNAFNSCEESCEPF